MVRTYGKQGLKERLSYTAQKCPWLSIIKKVISPTRRDILIASRFDEPAHSILPFFLYCPCSPDVPVDSFSCEVESWCPVEVDALPLGKRRALMARAEEYTVFVKNSIAFPYFGAEYVRNNLVSSSECSIYSF